MGPAWRKEPQGKSMANFFDQIQKRRIKLVGEHKRKRGEQRGKVKINKSQKGPLNYGGT